MSDCTSKGADVLVSADSFAPMLYLRVEESHAVVDKDIPEPVRVRLTLHDDGETAVGAWVTVPIVALRSLERSIDRVLCKVKISYDIKRGAMTVTSIKLPVVSVWDNWYDLDPQR